MTKNASLQGFEGGGAWVIDLHLYSGLYSRLQKGGWVQKVRLFLGGICCVFFTEK